MKLRFLATLFCLSVLGLACGNEDAGPVNGSPSPGSGMVLGVKVHGKAVQGDPLTVSFTYKVIEDSGWNLPDTLIATSAIEHLGPNFELVSTDSVWVDTLHVSDTVEHSFVIRPLYRVAVHNCVSVTSSVEEGLTIGANDCFLVDTR